MGLFAQDALWTPPELVPELVAGWQAAFTTRARYLHADHDNLDQLLARIDDVRERDLNAIRLRR
jgi:hypothetical protein